MKKLIMAFLVIGLIQGCSKEQPVLKSPCVGAADSPCDQRRPVNEHWLKTLPS